MNIISFEFFLFILFALVLYYIVPKKKQWTVLLLFSAYFIYCGNEIVLCAVFSGMVLATYCTGILIEKSENKRGWILFAGISINIAAWIYFKETDLFTINFNMISKLAGAEIRLDPIRVLAPIGISYYTFSLTGYLVDVYWGLQKPQKNFARFALYAGYFPLLTSGPIVKYREVEKDLFGIHYIDFKNIYLGIQRIIWGVFKKLVISERAAVIVNCIWGKTDQYNGLFIWIAAALFVLQLYTDFSGCIDIIMGVSDMFGINLPENFDMPFIARNVSEWWRRWHITLGSWLKDYVLYSVLKTETWKKLGNNCKKIMGGGRKKLARKIPVWCGLFLSWLFIGLWHGGTYNYVMAGLFFWVVIVLGELCEPLFQKIIVTLKINVECFSWHLFQSVRTFCIYVISTIFWRSYGGMAEAVNVFKASVKVFNPHILFDGSLWELGLDKQEFYIMMFAVLIMAIGGMIKMCVGCFVWEWVDKQNLIFRLIVVSGMIILVILFGVYGPGVDASEFIYQQF